ncbi:mitochondrial inner membrane protease ATP23 protein [Dioscorea alata]|uniref:Mitochondrial inner membrane protease ATP23 n=2 Tax=Dioscorea TaxID=4672 RepID=A0AB40C1I6_DIOCR|nr:mitochondrial inner membrane protease ATP23 [Dioscorea cayenensis subsp. rotundata]KAH7670663.1 mitochondrial inner membrane protease ATP23 protein [Dioscorea alata]
MDEGAGVPIREVNTGTENSNPYAGMSQKECTDRIRKALSHPTVKFLRQHMEKAGCPVWVRLLMAVNCKEHNFAGGYSSQNGVSVCCNRMTFQDEINQVIIHELIHAYDDCRVKNMDWKNCAHHACSEIRANHLSGDCHYKRELLRGFMKIRGHEQECVKRRAIKSVAVNPNCSEAAAKDAVEAVWDICYNDTYPFDRAP